MWKTASVKGLTIPYIPSLAIPSSIDFYKGIYFI